MIEHRISRMAVAALLLGTAFYIPIVTGFVAVIFGISAVRAIRKSKGYVLGKGLAVSGIILGAVHGVLWVVVVFDGTIFKVEPKTAAVVVRNGIPVRVERYGAHLKVPFIDSVYLYPVERSYDSAVDAELMLSTKMLASAEVSLRWQICRPLIAYSAFGKFDKWLIDVRISSLVKDVMRTETAKVERLEFLAYDASRVDRVHAVISHNLSSFGVCLERLRITPRNDMLGKKE